MYLNALNQNILISGDECLRKYFNWTSHGLLTYLWLWLIAAESFLSVCLV